MFANDNERNGKGTGIAFQKKRTGYEDFRRSFHFLMSTEGRLNGKAKKVYFSSLSLSPSSSGNRLRLSH